MAGSIQLPLYIDNVQVMVVEGNFTYQDNSDFSVDNQGYALYKGKRFYYNGVLVLGSDYPHTKTPHSGSSQNDYYYFTINDLTNTKWVLNSSFTTMPYGELFSDENSSEYSFSINYSTNNLSFTNIAFGDDDASLNGIGTYNNGNLVFWNISSWSNQAYRIISITGGTDATNTNLISWLFANATQVPVVDLSGTEWSITSTTCSAGYGKFSINGMITNQLMVLSLLGIGYNRWGTTATANSINYNDDTYGSIGDIISITNGTDITNPNLIVWLTNNATYQEPEPTGINNVSIGTLKLAKALVGSDEISQMWLGDVKIYEKGGSTPSGYTITLSFVGNADPAVVNVEINGVIQNDWASGETKVYTNVETLNIGTVSVGSVAIGNKTGSLVNYYGDSELQITGDGSASVDWANIG